MRANSVHNLPNGTEGVVPSDMAIHYSFPRCLMNKTSRGCPNDIRHH